MNAPTNDPGLLLSDSGDLRKTLDALEGSGRRRLNGWRFRLALREAVGGALLWLFVPPLFLLVVGRARQGLSLPGIAGVSEWGRVLISCLLGPILYVAIRVSWSCIRFHPTRAAALALHDKHLDGKDRLVTADEFLSSSALNADTPQGGFMRAAVDDARPLARAAQSKPLPDLPVPGWALEPRSLWGIPAAAAVVLLGWIFTGHGGSRPDAGGLLAIAANLPQGRQADNPGPTSRRVPPRPPVRAESAGDADKSQSTPQQLHRTQKSDKPMEGQPASGGGSHASSSSNGTHAAGLASSKRQPPGEKPKDTVHPEEPEEPEAPDDRKPVKKKTDTGQLATEANSGQGKSSAASGNLNSFAAPEEQDKTGQGTLADAKDESSEDEDEQEKSNAVSRPMGETKKPPVNRNLASSPPGDPSDAANGRGGPGPVKKTRGVPSMILGIPYPDRVPGTPGPGRSKVTQEYTRPKEESYPLQDALAQIAREGPIGHIEQPDLVPWRRELVESYFIKIRTQTDEPR